MLIQTKVKMVMVKSQRYINKHLMMPLMLSKKHKKKKMPLKQLSIPLKQLLMQPMKPMEKPKKSQVVVV